MITQEQVKGLFDYDPQSGGLRWRNKRHGPKGKNVVGVNHSLGYRTLRIGGIKTLMYAHKIIWLYMTGVFPKQIDHINGDPSDNKWNNLRECTQQQNCQNSKARGNNKYSKYKGVCKMLHVFNRPWKSYITIDKKTINLGHYATAEEAARMYNRIAKKAFGEFARLNEIE